MKQKIIAVNINGTIIRASPLLNARQKMFELMAYLLEDPAAVSYVKSRDTMKSMYELLEKHTGLSPEDDSNKKILTEFANSVMTMNYLNEITKLGRKHLLIEEFAEWLKAQRRKGFRITLVTTTPEPVAKHVLDVLNCSDLFDDIQTVPKSMNANTKEALDSVKMQGDVICYIGKTLYDVYAAKACKIPIIVPTWDLESSLVYKEAENQADHKPAAIEELDRIFSRLTEMQTKRRVVI